MAVATQVNRGCEDGMLPGDIAGALGGAANVRTVDALHGRYRVELADAAKVDEGALARLTRGLVRPRPDVCHILICKGRRSSRRLPLALAVVLSETGGSRSGGPRQIQDRTRTRLHSSP